MNAKSAVTLYPLGGLGEIGLNCMAMVSGDSMIVVDCGLMFPDDSLFGIDVVIPRFDFLLANKDKLKVLKPEQGTKPQVYYIGLDERFEGKVEGQGTLWKPRATHG